jgi:hypothetical protein
MSVKGSASFCNFVFMRRGGAESAWMVFAVIGGAGTCKTFGAFRQSLVYIYPEPTFFGADTVSRAALESSHGNRSPRFRQLPWASIDVSVPEKCVFSNRNRCRGLENSPVLFPEAPKAEWVYAEFNRVFSEVLFLFHGPACRSWAGGDLNYGPG